MLPVRKGKLEELKNIVSKKNRSDYIKIWRTAEGKILRMLLSFSLFKILYHTSKNPAFPVHPGQIMRSAEAKPVTHGFFYGPESGLSVFHSHETYLQSASFPLSQPVQIPPHSFISQSNATLSSMLSRPLAVRSNLFFSELTKYLTCAFVMTFSTFVTGSQPRIHI